VKVPVLKHFRRFPIWKRERNPLREWKWLMLNVYMNRIFTYETYTVCIRGPHPQIECLTVWSGADVIIETKCTVNATHLNHPKTISPNSWSMEKLYSMKLVSGAEKVADCWYICSKIYCKSLKNIFPQANQKSNGHVWSLYHFKRNLCSLERFVMSIFCSIHRYIYGSPV